MSIRVDIEKEKIDLTTLYSEPPIDKKLETFKTRGNGIEEFHVRLMKLRTDVPETDKVTMYSDDDVKYDKMILVLDAIKTLKESDPDLPIPKKEDGKPEKNGISQPL